MTRLYRKSEWSFALLWIAVYLAGAGLAGMPAAPAGLPFLYPALFHGALAVFLPAWIRRNGLCEKYGFFLPRYPLSRAWFFLPLWAAAGFPLFFCPALQPSAAPCFVVSLVCAGFLEELLFRGFLFRALEGAGPRRAVVLSSLAFSLCHLANWFGGRPLGETVLQMVFAAGAGVALAVLFYKGGSLLPCILFHSLNNALSAFAAPAVSGAAPASVLLPLAACLLLLAVYSAWLWRRLEP